MSMEIGNMIVTINANDNPFNQGLARVHANSLRAVGRLQGLETRGIGLFQAIGRSAMGAASSITAAFSGLAGGFGLAGLVAGLGYGVKLASDFGETSSKFGILFAESAKEASAALDDFGDRVGRSRTVLYEMAADFQGVTRGMTDNREEAARMAVTLSRLAVDLGSFNNISDSDAATRLQSGLIGNHEALRSLNVFISEATLKTELLKMGFKGNAEAATDQQKQIARLNIIMRETALAQGDAERTSGSFSNQMKALWAQVQEAGMLIGNFLTPALQVFISAAVDMLKVFRSNQAGVEEWGAALGVVVGNVMGFMRELAFAVYNYDTSWQALKLTVMEAVYGIWDRISWFLQAGAGGFAWFANHATDLILTHANNVLSIYINMAENIRHVFAELWGWLATAGEDSIDIHLKSLFEGFKKYDTSGLKEALNPEFKETDFSKERAALEDEINKRREKMNEIWKPKDGKAEAVGEAFGLPGMGKGKEKKLQLEIIANEQVFQKALADRFKGKQEAQMLQTNQQQLAEMKATRQDQSAQHEELVAAVSRGGFSFT